jgi:hypothetical protein
MQPAPEQHGVAEQRPPAAVPNCAYPFTVVVLKLCRFAQALNTFQHIGHFRVVTIL